MSLNVISQGCGPDAVFLHGWGLSARIWQSLADRLAPSLRCHLVDLPGHGDSPGGVVGLNNWVDAVAEALEPRVEGPAVYVGWSLGGLITLGMARRHPQQLRGMALVAALPRMVRDRDWAWGLKPSAIETTRRGLAQDFATTLSEFLFQQVLGEPGAARAVRSLRNDLIDRPPRPEALERGLDILFEADFRAQLPDIRVPSLWVAGARDRMAHPDGMDWACRQAADGRGWRVERAAHAPFVSHEKRFAERIAAFAAAPLAIG